MSESLSKDECGDSFSEGISDCNIENVMKEGQVKQETLENDCMMEEVKKEFDEGKNKNRESNMNLQVKEEPDQINYAYKSVQKVMKGDIKMMVKEEKKEPVQFEDIEMKVKEDKPVLCEVVEMKVKEEIKTNEQIKNEPDITSKIIESNHINDLNSSIGGLKTKNSHENKFEEKGSVSTYIDDIRDSILLVARPGTFAYGGVLEKAALQLSVEGVGRVKLPLSFKQGEILKSKCMAAPFGRGSETLVSKSVRDAWQVDAKDVTLDKKFKKLIKEQIADIIPTLMGESYTECHQVTSELYKLVYYEKGGHFVAHRDTEKAPGMFATLVIQLPADHMGGSLIVRHKGKTKVFDFQDDSINKYYFTAFFADCEHELKEVTAGQRLVLIYNLLNKNPHSTFNPHKEDNIKSNNNQNFMSIMRNSVQKWKADNKGPRYLALKLDHLYTNANTSFKKLKGKDKIIADALCSCEDIKVYLATINKNSMHWGGYARPKPKPKPIDDDTPDIWYSLDDWLGVNNNEPPFGERNLDTNEMLLKEEIFLKDDKRCGSDYEYTGNEGCTINYFYKKKVLVFFPKSYEIFISCEKNFISELDNCKKLSESSMDDALDRLKGILLYIEKRKSGTSFDLKRYDSIATIFEIMVKYEHTIICQANTFILTLSKPFAYSTDEKVGLPNTNSAVALANLINKVSWNSLGNSVLQLMKECATSHSESCTQLVSSLFSFGHVEPAISIVELVAPQIIAQNDDLRSRRSIAAWSVFLASHDVFSTHFDVFVKQISQMKDDALNKIIEQMYKSQNLQEIDQYRIKKCFQTFLRILQNNGWVNSSLNYVTLFQVILFVDKFDYDICISYSFVQAVSEIENSSYYLQKLLRLPNVVEAKDNSTVRLMVQKRLLQLEVPYPLFSWAQPNTKLLRYFRDSRQPELEVVSNFLLSDKETETFRGLFDNKPDAERFGKTYFQNGEYNMYGKYSARYELSGRGRNIEFKVIKTKDCFDAEVLTVYNNMCEEAKDLKHKFYGPEKSVSRKRALE